jgi:quercetin 2,3-dioxygenase
MNDDLVQPARGFGTHPHRDAEIVTYIVRGGLTHKDSMGTSETLGRGSIQFMTAGSGIRHSEHNLNPSDDLRFIQMWLTPRQRGLEPNYGSLVGGPQVDAARQGKWNHLVSDTRSDVDTPVQINTDANMYVSQIGVKDALSIEIAAGRMAYCLCIEGGVDLTNESDGREEGLVQHDACQVQPGRLLITTTSEEALVLLVEMSQ